MAENKDISTLTCRAQFPVAPAKQKTLHALRGSTADPGLLAHFRMPGNLSMAAKWLAYYVALSRTPSFRQLRCHGLPDREIMEGGPPPELLHLMGELFADKIESTYSECTRARVELGWPVHLQ